MMYRKIRSAARDHENLKWYCRYYLSPRTDRWYSSLFQPYSHQISGEITPAYAKLPDTDIARIQASFPNVKIIYILRNPIERMWSQAALEFSRRGNQGIQTKTKYEILFFLSQSQHLAHSCYGKNLQRWQRYFPPEQIFIGYFDQIRSEPRQLLKNIFRFLGVDDDDRFLPKSLHRKVNPRDYPSMTKHFRQFVANALGDDVEALHTALKSPYTEQWMDSIEQYRKR